MFTTVRERGYKLDGYYYNNNYNKTHNDMVCFTVIILGSQKYALLLDVP
jgi:hypothetical protein